jgi:hypothetical protein
MVRATITTGSSRRRNAGLTMTLLRVAFLSSASSTMLVMAGPAVPTALLAGAGISLVATGAVYNVDRQESLRTNPLPTFSQLGVDLLESLAKSPNHSSMLRDVPSSRFWAISRLLGNYHPVNSRHGRKAGSWSVALARVGHLDPLRGEAACFTRGKSVVS